MHIFIHKTMMKISLYCISSYFNFVFLQRRDQQEASFGGIFLQKAEHGIENVLALLGSRGLTEGLNGGVHMSAVC